MMNEMNIEGKFVIYEYVKWSLKLVTVSIINLKASLHAQIKKDFVLELSSFHICIQEKVIDDIVANKYGTEIGLESR